MLLCKKAKNGKPICKASNDQRGCTNPRCQFEHVCDVQLASGDACSNKNHKRDEHKGAKIPLWLTPQVAPAAITAERQDKLQNEFIIASGDDFDNYCESENSYTPTQFSNAVVLVELFAGLRCAREAVESLPVNVLDHIAVESTSALNDSAGSYQHLQPYETRPFEMT